MKRAYIVTVLSLCRLAFAGPDFSGRWIYDASLSTLPSTGDRIIMHTGKTFRITIDWDSRTQSSEYIVDGSEHTFLNNKGDSQQYKAVLDGNTLRITGKSNSRVAINHPFDVTYILSPDNKTLTFFTTIISSKGPIIRKQVYRKQ